MGLETPDLRSETSSGARRWGSGDQGADESTEAFSASSVSCLESRISGLHSRQVEGDFDAEDRFAGFVCGSHQEQDGAGWAVVEGGVERPPDVG